MPFISRSHYDDIIREKNQQIAYRDHRIAELDAERKLLWDKLCVLEIGEPLFEPTRAKTNQPKSGQAKPRAAQPPSAVKPEEVRGEIPASDLQPETIKQPEAPTEIPEEEPNPDLTTILINDACHSGHPEPEEAPQAKGPDSGSKYVRLGRPCPSQLMRRMDRIMHNRWLQKLHPAKAAEQKRDEVMAELDKAHLEGVKAGSNK